MAIGDLTLDQRRPERISKNVSMITGSIDIAGTTITAGVPVATAAAFGDVPSGRKISDFFDTVFDVRVTVNYLAGVRPTVSGLRTEFEYDITNDKVVVYTEAVGDSEEFFLVSNGATVVAGSTLNFVALGISRGN